MAGTSLLSQQMLTGASGIPSGVSGKNLALTPAASELGLGDALSQQVQDDVANRKKKMLDASNQTDKMNSMSAALTPGVASLMSGSIKGVL